MREWEDNIRIHITDVVYEGVNWMHLAQERDLWRTVLKRAINLAVLLKAVNFLFS
jgi:hypothetical protein